MGRDRRERPWRALSTSTTWLGADATARGAVAADLLEQTLAEQAVSHLLSWQQRRREPEQSDWHDVAGLDTSLLYLSSEEADEFGKAFEALVRPLHQSPDGSGCTGRRPDAGRDHPAARPVGTDRQRCLTCRLPDESAVAAACRQPRLPAARLRRADLAGRRLCPRGRPDLPRLPDHRLHARFGRHPARLVPAVDPAGIPGRRDGRPLEPPYDDDRRQRAAGSRAWCRCSPCTTPARSGSSTSSAPTRAASSSSSCPPSRRSSRIWFRLRTWSAPTGSMRRCGTWPGWSGSAIGGILATVAGISGLAFFDGVSFVLAAALLTQIRWRPTSVDKTAEDPASLGSLSRLLARMAGRATDLPGQPASPRHPGLHVHHPDGRRDHGHPVRAVREGRPARLRLRVRPDRRDPRGRRDHRRPRGHVSRPSLECVCAVRLGCCDVRDRRPGALPVSACAVGSLAGADLHADRRDPWSVHHRGADDDVPDHDVGRVPRAGLRRDDRRRRGRRTRRHRHRQLVGRGRRHRSRSSPSRASATSPEA